MTTTARTPFYIYVYLDPRKPGKYVYDNYEFDYEPFYVGKGINKRCFAHIKEAKKIRSLNIKISRKNFPITGNLCKINKILKILQTHNSPIILKREYNLSEIEAFFIEKTYIKTIGRYDLKKGPLTNMTDGGEGGPINHTIPVIQYNLSGFYVKEFNSIVNASECLKIERSSISRALAKKVKTAGSFIWFFKSHFKNNKIPKKLDYKIIKKLTNSERGKNKKRIIQFSVNGDFIKTFDSIEAAAKYNNFQRSYISKICKDKSKEYCKASGGFTWFFETDFHMSKIPKRLDDAMIKKLIRNQTLNKKIIQLSRDGKFIKRWDSLKEAARYVNVSASGITKVCSKKENTAGGFMWKYDI